MISNNYKYEKVIFGDGIELSCTINLETKNIFVLMKDLLRGLGLYENQIQEMVRRVDRDKEIRQKVEIIPSLLGMYEDYVPLANNGVNVFLSWVDGIYSTDVGPEQEFRTEIAEYLIDFYEKKGFYIATCNMEDKVEIEEETLENIDKINLLDNSSETLEDPIDIPSIPEIPLSSPIIDPLTREELAAYMLCQEQSIDAIRENSAEFIKGQTELIKSFINATTESQNRFFDSITMLVGKLTDAVSALSSVPIATSTSVAVDPTESDRMKNDDISYCNNISTDTIPANGAIRKSWKSETLLKISEFCNSHSCGINGVLVRVYAKMKKDHNINFAIIRSEEKLGCNNKIDIVNAMDDLKIVFDCCLKSVFKDIEECENVENPTRTPDIIFEELSPLVFEGENTNRILTAVYREMEKTMNGITLRSKLNEYREKSPLLKNASISYMIANNPHLLNKFREAVKRLA